MPTKNFSMHLLDVGKQKYGDAILCQCGKTSVLIDRAHPPNWKRDGKHPSIPEQLDKLLGAKQTHEVSLLIVSHAHQDHVGCLPKLVRDGVVRAQRVVLVHPDLAFPQGATDAIDAAPDGGARRGARAERGTAPTRHRPRDARAVPLRRGEPRGRLPRVDRYAAQELERIRVPKRRP